MGATSNTNIRYTDEIIEYNEAFFHTRSWSPPEGVTPIANLLFVHGFSEHITNYEVFANYFCSKGYNLFVFDQRGFGETSKDKDIAVTDDFHVFDDLEFFIERVQKTKDFTGKLFLLGHSMGGGIVINYSIIGKHKKELAGIVVCAPVLIVNPATLNSYSRMLMPFGSLLLPNYQVSTGLDASKLTHDMSLQKEIKEDKLSPFVGTVRQLYHMIRRGYKALDFEYAKNIERTVPVLIQHSNADQINDISGSRAFNKHGFENVKLLEYDGAYHSLYMESDEYRLPIFSDLETFLKDPKTFVHE